MGLTHRPKRPACLIEWVSARVWMEALEGRRLLSTTVTPDDVPAGYFRYWGAGSNPADRVPELAVPFLEGQGTFKGTLATFWGDAPNVSRVYWRLDATRDLVLDSKGEPLPDESSGAPYYYPDLPWQRVDIFDVPGPTFEVRGLVNLPDLDGQHYSEFAFVDDFGGNSYQSRGPVFYSGDPKALTATEHDGHHAYINVVSDSLTYIHLPYLEDRYWKAGDTYDVAVDWQDGTPQQHNTIVGELDAMGRYYQTSVELGFDATRYRAATLTITRTDGKASMTVKGDINDCRPQPTPAQPAPIPVSPAPLPTNVLPREVIGVKDFPSVLAYPSRVTDLGEFSFGRDSLSADTTIEICFYRITNPYGYDGDTLSALEVLARLPVSAEPIVNNHYKLSMPGYDLMQGANKFSFVLTRGTEQVELRGGTITTYQRGMTPGGKHTPYITEGEWVRDADVGSVIDVMGFAPEDYAATMTFEDGTAIPLKVTFDGTVGEFARYRFSADLTVWAIGQTVPPGYTWDLARKAYTVTVTRGGEALSFDSQLRIQRGEWIHPIEPGRLNVPPVFWLEEPQGIVDADGEVEVHLKLHDELDGRLPLPQVKFEWDSFYRSLDWDQMEADATIIKTADGYEAVATLQFGDYFSQSYTASIIVDGKVASSAYGSVLVSPTLGDSDLYLNWDARFLAAAGIDFGEVGYAFAAAYLGSLDASVGLDEYSVEVTCSDGSPMRGFVSQNTKVFGSDIVVMVQPHVVTPGKKTVYISVRYRDRVATFTSSMDVWPRSGLPENLPEWETGSSYPYNDGWGWDIERTESDPLPLPAVLPPTPPSANEGDGMEVGGTASSEDEQTDEMATWWSWSGSEVVDWRESFGSSLLDEGNEDLLVDQTEILG